MTVEGVGWGMEKRVLHSIAPEPDRHPDSLFIPPSSPCLTRRPGDVPMGDMGGYVYIMASKRYGTIYVGVTANLPARAYQHKQGLVAGFTRRYGVRDLVYYERHERIEGAIQREHNIKHWPRRWKTQLVDSVNPDWDDLYPTLI